MNHICAKELYSCMYVCVLTDHDAALRISKNELHLHLGIENILKNARLQCCSYRPDAALGRTTNK